MSSRLLDVIRIANREFQEFIDQASQSGPKAVESRAAVSLMGKIDLRLKQVSRHLAAASKATSPAPEVADEVMKYQETLKTLKRVMDAFQSSLPAGKSRVDNARTNMRAACAWATSVREIS